MQQLRSLSINFASDIQSYGTQDAADRDYQQLSDNNKKIERYEEKKRIDCCNVRRPAHVLKLRNEERP